MSSVEQRLRLLVDLRNTTVSNFYRQLRQRGVEPETASRQAEVLGARFDRLALEAVLEDRP
jgi:hypothetical protein